MSELKCKLKHFARAGLDAEHFDIEGKYRGVCFSSCVDISHHFLYLCKDKTGLNNFNADLIRRETKSIDDTWEDHNDNIMSRFLTVV